MAITDQNQSERIVGKMIDNDPFSEWLGIEPLEIHPGRVVLQMKVRAEMLNGFGVCHGGIPFSLADSAVAFASNTRGRLALALDNNISYPAPIREGDVLVATAEELSLSNHIGIYQVTIINEEGRKVALFRGTVYRTSQPHI